MKEIKGNLFLQADADAICITTNGIVKKNGCCTMGVGCAMYARENFKNIDKTLGIRIDMHGNHVHFLGVRGCYEDSSSFPSQAIYSFPVKHHWKDLANIELIKRSASEIVEFTKGMKKVVIPQPGCGYGGLKWSEVKLILEEILSDDRFYIISF